MRGARRLVEGTDDVVSDVPPPGMFGGGDARETVVRGRAVECELRHRPGGCIYRGGAGTLDVGGGPQVELDGNIITSEKQSQTLTRVTAQVARSARGLPPPSNPSDASFSPYYLLSIPKRL